MKIEQFWYGCKLKNVVNMCYGAMTVHPGSWGGQAREKYEKVPLFNWFFRFRWRRRPRQFVNENHFVLNFRSDTEMTNLKKPKSRFAAIKEFAKRRKKRKTPINCRDYGHSGVAGMFAPNSSTRKGLERESPIASLWQSTRGK